MPSTCLNLKAEFPNTSKITAQFSVSVKALSSLFSDSMLGAVAIQPGLVKSMTVALFASKIGLRRPKLLAPARMMVKEA